MGSRKSKIKLTKSELHFAGSTGYPLAKQKIVQKMSENFSDLAARLNESGNELLHSAGGHRGHKITKGENYRGLPYLVLDVPKISGSEFPFLYRTLFWWGRYISFSIFIRTSLLDVQATAGKLAELKGTSLLTGNDLWENDLESPAYRKLRKMKQDEVVETLEKSSYLKVVSKISIEAYRDLDKTGLDFLEKAGAAIVLKKEKPEKSGSQ